MRYNKKRLLTVPYMMNTEGDGGCCDERWFKVLGNQIEPDNQMAEEIKSFFTECNSDLVRWWYSTGCDPKGFASTCELHYSLMDDVARFIHNWNLNAARPQIKGYQLFEDTNEVIIQFYEPQNMDDEDLLDEFWFIYRGAAPEKIYVDKRVLKITWAENALSTLLEL